MEVSMLPPATNNTEEFKLLEDLFKGYGVRLTTIIKFMEMGFTASTLVNMKEQEIDDVIKTMMEGHHMELLVGEKYGLKSAIRAENKRQEKEMDRQAKNNKKHKSDDSGMVATSAEDTIVDKSKDWAASVLIPFDHESIAESENLKNALNEPLPLKIPVCPELYKKLDPQIVEHFVSTDVYRADTIASYINIFMSHSIGGGSQQSFWDIIFTTFWTALLDMTQTNMITINRNVTDPLGASSPRARPDLLLWSVRRLVAIFEEKKDTLYEAYRDLVNKLSVLPRQFYGPVDWIIGVGLAGGEMCVWALKQGHQGDCLYGPVEMKYPLNKYECILVSVNLLRIALTLKSVFSKLAFMPVPYMDLPPLTYGKQDNLTRRIQIVWPKVIKKIYPWSMHVREGFTTLEYVKTAYSLKIPQLIKGGCSLSRNDQYKVILDEVGYEELIISEFAMKHAIKDVLHALNALHGAGLVHRDVQWKNILKKADGGWILIDLETVWKRGEQPTCLLRAWDENTLDGGTHFTEKSDLYLVGKLMQLLPNSGHSLRSCLLNRAYDCAEDALKDDWLHQQ